MCHVCLYIIDVTVLMVDLQSHIEAFKHREKAPGPRKDKSAALDEIPQFLNGRKLRDYQVWKKGKNCSVAHRQSRGHM